MIAVFDTNIVIDALNGVTQADDEYSRYERVLISLITWMEVLVGTEKRMKSKRSSILLFMALTAIVSAACFLSSRAAETPTPNYPTFAPVTTPLKIEPDSLPTGQVGVGYEVDIHVSDNVTPVYAVSISNGTLPAGLELVFVDGVDGAKITGAPEEAGTFTFTISVSCFGTMVSGQTGEKEYKIIVEQ
jgi:hypothetical protein